ncbi:MAG: S41 family peptidase [Fimbriimonas sp.]
MALRVGNSPRWAAGTSLLWVASGAMGQTTEPRLLRTPAIHGDTLVFSYAGDLWVSEAGGAARRLTSHPGLEIRPKISSDGRWVAFDGAYDGMRETYLLPIEGGEPRRLTYGTGGQTLGWTSDGKIALASSQGNFTSRQSRLWFVDPKGGLPIRTPIAEISAAAFPADGKSIVYTRRFPSNWRRYRGGTAAPLSVYDFAANAYRELPAGRGQNLFPMVVGRAVYYVSDKNQATMNLYRCDLDGGKDTQLTRFTDADIRSPYTDGKTIVWERDGRLETLEIATGKIARPSLKIPSELLLTRPSVRYLGDAMSTVTLSPNGSRVAIEARGELFTVPVKAGDTRNLTRTSGVRELAPRWSPDGANLGYLSDVSGNYEVYTQPTSGGEPTRLTNANGTIAFRSLEWSPDGKWLELRTIANDLYLLNAATKELTLVTRLASRSLPTDWSPDSKWLALINNGANRQGALHLYEVATKRLTKVTDGLFSDNTMAFDRNGRYLYLRSSRNFAPGFGRFEYSFRADNTERLYLIPLEANARNPLRTPVEDEPAPAPATGRVDLAGMGERLIPLPIPAGNYFSLLGVKDGVLFVSTTAGSPTVTVNRFDLNSRRTETIYTGLSANLSFNADRTKMAIVSGRTIRVADVRPGAGDAGTVVDTSDIKATIDPRAEWRQIFWDAWRFQRDTFYDPKMRGLDWPAIGRQYEAYLPYVAHREDLNTVISGMINELGTSHAYVSGGDMGPGTSGMSMGYLGADYEVVEDAIRFAKVYQGDGFDEFTRGPLAEPGYRVETGEYLLAINGQPVNAKAHPNTHLVGEADRYVTLTVNSTPSLTGARQVRVRTVSNESAIRYADWVESTRRYVERASGGRIGYMHLPNVLHDGAAAFMRGFYGQTDKEAVIVDERWNAGGYFIQQLIVEMLTRKPLLALQERNAPDSFSVRAIEGPKAMLINEYAGSGGDSFPWTFRAGGAGKLIGRRTMGALVGLNTGLTLVDGGTVDSPEVGIYDPKTGELAAENFGVEPDIDVDMRPDLVAKGQDPQVDAAIKHLLEELRKTPKREPRKDLPRIPPGGRIGKE